MENYYTMAKSVGMAVFYRGLYDKTERNGRMETGVIRGAEQMRVFAPLLLPHVREAMKRGEPVTALGLTDGQIAAGALAGHLEDGIFQLDSLYVAPAYRRQGGATLLFEALTRLLEDWNTGINVRFVHTNEEQDSLHPFLEHMGYTLQDDSEEQFYVTTLEELMQQPFFANASKRGTDSFASVPRGLLYAAELTAKQKEDFVPIPKGGLLGTTVDTETSVVHMSGGKVDAYVAVDRSICGHLTLAALWSTAKNPAVLAGLLRAVAARAAEKYPAKTTVAFQTVTRRSLLMVQYLVPNAKCISYEYYKRV